MHRRTLDIIFYKTYAELRSEAQRTYIGLLWWLFEPILFMLIFYFVFGTLFKRGTEDFIPFLLTGLVVFQWFQRTVSQCANAILANRPLLQQVYVPKIVFPTVMILTNTLKFLVAFLLLMLFFVFYGIEVGLGWLRCIPVIGVIFLFIAGSAYLVAAVTPMIPDLRVVIENLMRGLLFLSGIFYDIESLGEPFASWLHLNPLAVVIESLRDVLMYADAANWQSLLLVSVASAAVGALGIAIMRYNESRYAKIVL